MAPLENHGIFDNYATALSLVGNKRVMYVLFCIDSSGSFGEAEALVNNVTVNNSVLTAKMQDRGGPPARPDYGKDVPCKSSHSKQSWLVGCESESFSPETIRANPVC